jgi:septum formation topological specificity factor MinE
METHIPTPGGTALEGDVDALVHLHGARRRLMLAMERKRRLGEPTDGLEAELAALQREVLHVVAGFAPAKEDGAR